MEELKEAQNKLMAEAAEKEKRAKEAAEALEKKKSELSNQENKLKEASSRVDGALNELGEQIGAESPVSKNSSAATTPPARP